MQTIKLPSPNLNRGIPIMQAYSKRASVRRFSSKEIKLEDLSDLLWAANGVNRPHEGKRTAPSALNSQDIDIYVFIEKGVFLYNAQKHQLDSIIEGDHRSIVASGQSEFGNAALMCVLVSNSSDPVWAAIDAGIVSQNISLFCASEDFLNRPRITMNKASLNSILNLKPSQELIMNNVVSY